MATAKTKSKPRTKPRARKRAGQVQAALPVKASLVVRRGRPQRAIEGTWDSSLTTRHNQKHWAYADSNSADGSATSSKRKVLRERARYELRNNSYAAGIVDTLANFAVGTGPHLQIESGDAATNAKTERLWREWARAVRLGEKLRLARKATCGDGETFAVARTNRRIKSAVKLDIEIVECDRVGAPLARSLVDDPNFYDGIEYDGEGNPSAYWISETYSGYAAAAGLLDYTRTPARLVSHLFKPARPGQSRGVTEIAPALDLFAQLRRYSAAVIDAAETAADFAGILQSTQPGADQDAAEVDALDLIEIERRMLMTVPRGWQLAQFKAEQPATTHDQFVKRKMNEIARCLNMPLNIALCDSSGYNYASGRLDHQTFFRSLEIDRDWLSAVFCDWLFGLWLEEARLVPNYLPPLMLAAPNPSPAWRWDGFEHVDPAKEANAATTLKKGGLMTDAYYFARRGLDWEAEYEQLGRERAKRKQLGLPEQDSGSADMAQEELDNEDAQDE